MLLRQLSITTKIKNLVLAAIFPKKVHHQLHRYVRNNNIAKTEFTIVKFEEEIDNIIYSIKSTNGSSRVCI